MKTTPNPRATKKSKGEELLPPFCCGGGLDTEVVSDGLGDVVVGVPDAEGDADPVVDACRTRILAPSARAALIKAILICLCLEFFLEFLFLFFFQLCFFKISLR